MKELGQQGVARRRSRAALPRRRQVVLRLSDAEYDVVRRRAALAGLAVGAWIGQTALDAAERGAGVQLGLPDLLRLHADIVLFERAAAERVDLGEQVVRLLVRLDAVVDGVVAAHGGCGP